MDTAFLDLDGLCANFIRAACNSFGIEYPKNSTLSYGWLDEKVGLPPDEFWKKLSGEDFWESIEPFPWAQSLVDIVKDSGVDWRFLSKPTYDPGCYSGKYKWVKKHFGKDVNKLILINGNKGVVCPGKNALLIDDREENIMSWFYKGGSVYHWPEVTEDTDVTKRLEDIRKLLK